MEQIIVTHVDNTTLKLQSKANRSSVTKFTQNVELLGADTIDISVESATKLNFYIGDKITVIGRDYTLNTPPIEKKYSEKSFTYDLQFEGVQYDLMRASYSVNVDTTTNQIQDLNGEALTGDLKMFLDVLISNVNRVFPNKWVLGTYPQNTETRNEVFGESDNCLSVLQSLCGEDKYNTEFSIAIGEDGVRTLNVGPTGNVFPFTFEYGRGKGIYELTRERISSSNIITRLNVFGSSKNIITTKYRASRLCLPTKNKSQSYLDDAAAIAKFGVWENTKIFEDIFPHRTGTVTAVDDHLTFSDSSMDFDLNAKDGEGNTLYLVPGTSAKIHFKTGNLAGYEFELTSYTQATKKFKVIQQIDENGYKFPSESTAAFQFAVGDEYTITDIYLPQSYVDTAEAALQTAGQSYLDKYKAPNVQYSISEIDPFFLSRVVGAEVQTNIIWVGDYIPVKDTDLDIDKSLRVKSFSRDLLKDYSYSISVAENAVSVTMITRIISDLNGIDNIVSINNLRDPARARRNYKATSELVTMIDVVKAEAVLIGNDPASQYSLTGVAIRSNYQSNPNSIQFTAGSIAHNYYPVGSPGIWSITAGTFADLTPATAYYAYIKASKSEATAIYFLSSTKIDVESVSGFFHFPLGILSSVIDGARVFTTTKGYTLITGDSIRTGKVTSSDGLTYFDLDSGVIQGKITFLSGSSGYGNLTDKPDLSVYSLQADVNAIVSNLQAQIDGQIMSWFDTYIPTLSNAPATSWTTTAIKDAHLGDLFYNKSTGLGYRFSKTGSVYSWELLKDTDVALALANAAAAQDTADGKRRVFVAQPTTPYEVGDLWSQGTSGDIMKCKVTRLTGSYNASDWEKAAKYTDDTAANNAAEIARAMQYGKMLYRDPMFANGMNGISRYNWNPSGLEITREVAQADSPNVGYNIMIFVEDPTGIDPGLGGFYFATQSRANAIFITRIVAKIPIGYTLNFASNATGNNPIEKWLTPQAGTGRFEEYVFYLKCGESGTFSSTNFFYLKGPTDSQVYWFLAFATVYDITDTDITTIDKSAADILAMNYLKTALQGSTDITGGLLATNVLLMKNSNGVIRGGFSGLSSDNIGIWAGGTYADAIAALAKIIFRKDGSGQLAGGKILFKSDGDLSVGVVEIDAVGNLLIKDSGGVVRVLITNNNISILASIENSTQNSTVTNNGSSYSNVGTASIDLTNALTVNNNNSQVRLTCTLMCEITSEYINSEAYGYVEIKLVNRETNQVISLDSISLYKYNHYYEAVAKAVDKTVVLEAGTYDIVTYYSHEDNSGGDSSFSSNVFSPVTAYITFDGSTQRIEIGKNGIGIIGDGINYSFFGIEGGVYKSVEKTTGVFDRPGVLAAASVNSSGGNICAWGAKVGTSSKTSTGTYTIAHSIGHVNYMVQITPYEASRVGYIYSKTTTSVVIKITNLSGTLVDTYFDYSIVGNNQ